MREMTHFSRTFHALFEKSPPTKTNNNEPGKHREGHHRRNRPTPQTNPPGSLKQYQSDTAAKHQFFIKNAIK